MPAWLNDSHEFPDAESADEHGLVAGGGDLGPGRLLAAYRAGIFPWTYNPITWWSPDPRTIIELDGFHISRSLARTIRKGEFRVSRDEAFPQVIAACAEPGRREGDWITPEFIAAYTRLHELGHAHSVECWSGNELAGGIYGVTVGGLFAGESMFHRKSNASKVALAHLVEHLKARGFVLMDIQVTTDATLPLGATEISRSEYLRRLAEAVDLERLF